MAEAYIYDALRTPRGRGKASGALYEVKPVYLLATTLKALQRRTQLPPDRIDDLIIGCVTPIDDQGFNIARAAALSAGWEQSAGGIQVNRFCTSGLEAVNLAAAKVAAGWDQLIVAGGVESMSRVPMGSDGGPLMYDPATILSSKYIPQGIAADLVATLRGFNREALDAYALRSNQRAAHAQREGYFKSSLEPIRDRSGLVILDKDEEVRPDTDIEQLRCLAPSFAELGAEGFDAMAIQRYPMIESIYHYHTAGNSCGVTDGAACVLVGDASVGHLLALPPRARIVATATAVVDATIMLTGGEMAARRALKRAGMTVSDIDLWEFNEAFAAVVLQFQSALNIEDDRLNVNGGAIAFGHPLGASGAMLVNMLLDELERRSLQTGCVVVSAGAGLAVATVFQRL